MLKDIGFKVYPKIWNVLDDYYLSYKLLCHNNTVSKSTQSLTFKVQHSLHIAHGAYFPFC